MLRLTIVGLLAAGSLMPAVTPDGRGFPSPAAAAKALIDAAKTDDVAKLTDILGPSAKEILVTSDPVADQQMRRKFADAARARMKIVVNSHHPRARTLLVGKDQWPLPIPITRVNGKWYFDLDEGKREILARRIGSNELDAIEVCRGYVEAQNEYVARERTPNGVARYAQKIISTPGKQDGLYWPAANPKDESPMGELISRAFAEGYTNRTQPYHGYYFKVLTIQGPHATGGRMSYLQNGLMTKGFALIAWPADYESTGIMTFIVDKTGIVYQKNLGAKTPQIARNYSAYDPDQSWVPVATSARK